MEKRVQTLLERSVALLKGETRQRKRAEQFHHDPSRLLRETTELSPRDPFDRGSGLTLSRLHLNCKAHLWRGYCRGIAYMYPPGKLTFPVFPGALRRRAISPRLAPLGEGRAQDARRDRITPIQMLPPSDHLPSTPALTPCLGSHPARICGRAERVPSPKPPLETRANYPLYLTLPLGDRAPFGSSSMDLP